MFDFIIRKEIDKRKGEIEGGQAPEGEENPPNFENIPPTSELNKELRKLERYIKTEENK